MNGNMNGGGGEGCGPEGVRSLLSDANGVVMAETVYRCFVCHLITESTEEAYDHFQIEHANELKKQGQLQLNNASGGGSRSGGPKTGGRQAPKQNQTTHSSGAKSSAARRKTSFTSNNSFQQHTGGESDLDETAAEQDDSYQDQDIENQEYVPVEDMKPTPQTPSSAAKKNTYSTPQQGTMTDIECDVCGAHKSYSYYQRRYGAESCVPCSKFFKMFLYDPKEYPCVTGANNCPLASDGDGSVCKSCRLTGCLNTYVTNIDRYPAVVDFLNKTGRSGDLDRMRQVWKAHIAEQGGNAQGGNAKAPKAPVTPQMAGRKRTAEGGSSNVVVSKRTSKGSLSLPTTPAGGLKIKPNVNLIKSMPKITFKIKAGSGLLPNLNKASLSALSNQYSSVKSIKKSPSSSPTKSPGGGGGSASGSRVPPSVVRTKENASLVGHLSRGPNCGTCENCIRNDCGVCFHCKDKRKFGGANKIKKKCLKRICVNNLKPGSASGGSGGNSNMTTRGSSRQRTTAADADDSMITADDQSDLDNTEHTEQIILTNDTEQDFDEDEEDDLDTYDHIQTQVIQPDQTEQITEIDQVVQEIEEEAIEEMAAEEEQLNGGGHAIKAEG